MAKLKIFTGTGWENLPTLRGASGAPHGSYANLAALNAANPDHDYVYITQDNGNWNYWNGSAFVDGGAYQIPNDTVNEIDEDIRRIESIARGKATGYTFDTLAQLDAWLDGTYARPDGKTRDDLIMGDNLYIRDVSVKDYWWDADTETRQELEAEAPDLTDYYTKQQIDNRLPMVVTESEYAELVANSEVISDRIYYVIPDGE